MESLRVISNDIEATIKQTFDDKSITRAQVVYWISIVSNQLKAQHISKRDSGAFLTVFSDVPVNIVKQNENPNVVKGRKFIELPGSIFDFDFDRGIEYISYESTGSQFCPPRFTVVTFSRTTPKSSHWLYKSKYTSPKPSEPYFYRISNKLYFLGIEGVDIKNVEIGIYMTVDPIAKVDIDAPFNFPQELLHILKRQVVDLARFSFFFPASRTNDGNDDVMAKTQPIPKIISVNDQQNQQQ